MRFTVVCRSRLPAAFLVAHSSCFAVIAFQWRFILGMVLPWGLEYGWISIASRRQNGILGGIVLRDGSPFDVYCECARLGPPFALAFRPGPTLARGWGGWLGGSARLLGSCFGRLWQPFRVKPCLRGPLCSGFLFPPSRPLMPRSGLVVLLYTADSFWRSGRRASFLC